MTPASSGQSPLVLLLELARRARASASAQELAFLLVNESRALAPYRQAALWLVDGGVTTLSGVVQTESNTPYVQWLDHVCRVLHQRGGLAQPVGAADLPAAQAQEWAEWLPTFGLWLALDDPAGNGDGGGLLLAAQQPWQEADLALLQEWVATWQHAWRACHRPSPWSRQRLGKRLGLWLARRSDLPYWKRPRWRLAAAVLVILVLPVRLTVLAPGELVAANPAVIRAPLDGVIGQFHVQPNQVVKTGQLLFGFDEAALAARRDVAAQVLATAETEYRQFAQQALSDNKYKSQLAMLLGKIEEKRSEAQYLNAQLARSRVVAPQDGIALFDDPAEWVGKPVQTGERVMRIAAPADVEIEAWVALGDAIPLPEGAAVSFYLAASPLSSLAAHVRYMAHDAVARPSGSYAYRVRARLAQGTEQRVGLKGTVKISGGWVPLVYWMLRRPLATMRQTLGV